MGQGVLVVGEMLQGHLTSLTREVLGLGRSLADDCGEEVSALLIGPDSEDGARQAVAHGADIVLFNDSKDAEFYQPDLLLSFAEEGCKRAEPGAILLAHSPVGSDLAPRLARRLGTSWAPGCIGLRRKDGVFVHTRLEFGGKVLLEEAWENLPAVVSVRPKSQEPALENLSRQGQVHRLPDSLLTALSTRTVERVEKAVGLADQLAKAGIVAGGGRGLGSRDAFDTLRELASLLRGTAGASKKAVDMDWVPAEMQIGMSGTTIAPRLYLAVGISGASQHMMGCSKSKTIVAINKDTEAPIFRYARYGIVGEWQRVLPALMDVLRDAN